MAVVNAYEVELLTTQYSTALEMLLQQMDSRLRGCVTSASYRGKLASPVQYIGPVQFKQAAARGSTLQPQTVGYQRRWITPRDFDLPIHVDSFDELRTIIDPKSQIVASINAAAGRLFDDIIIGAFFGTAQLGVDASNLTTETFNSGSDFPIAVVIADTVGTGSACGLNVEKLLEAKRIFKRYENDMDSVRPHIAYGAQQEKDLMRQIEVVNADFNGGKSPYMGGALPPGFMGFDWHPSERLLTTGSDRRIPVWLQDGMHLGVWRDMTTKVSQRDDLASLPWQAYSMVSINATRLQGGKVIEMDCLDTATPVADITV